VNSLDVCVFKFVGDKGIITDIKRGGETAARTCPTRWQLPGIVSCARVVYLCRPRRMTDNITFRKATTTDAGAIARVQVGSWRDSYRGVVAQAWLDSLSVERRTEVYQQRLAVPGEEFYELLVAECAGEVVGICDVGEPRNTEFGCAGELYSIYLTKVQQRRGIGHGLFRAALELLLAAGRNSMYLEALAQNPYRGFYDKRGGIVFAHGALERLGHTHPTVFYKWPDLAQTLRTLQAERAC
jgi:GNAT superfamily N-acetyltransferase